MRLFGGGEKYCLTLNCDIPEASGQDEEAIYKMYP